MRDIFKIFTIFTPSQQRYCAAIVGCMVLGATLEAIGIGAILPFIFIMGDGEFLNRHPLVQQSAAYLSIDTHGEFIIAAALMLLAFFVLKNTYMAWLTKLQIKFSTNNQIVYARELFAEYINKPYLYHLDKNSATLLRNVSGGPGVVFSAILIPTFTLLTEIITAIAIWSMLVLVDAFTAVVIAGLLGLMMYAILKMFRRRITKQGQSQNTYSALYMKWLNQGLGAIKETKVFRKEEYFLNEFNTAYHEYGETNGKFNFINQMPRLMIETLVTCGLLMLIVVKLIMGTQPAAIVPLLGVLALAAFRLMPCANRIVNLSNSIKFQMPVLNLLYDELISIKNRQVTKSTVRQQTSSVILPFQQAIIVDKLSFTYPEGQKQVLDRVSFTIPKGSFAGIVGQSGAGKTTFVDILLGLLEPDSGTIKVDEQDIFADIRAWQANLAYVPQSIYLIDGSIRENIALGIPESDIDDKKIKRVLKMAELYDFINELPEKIYTNVGERGVKLSGGQRQRIGIARALYYEPEVLILDEATSALDNETEKSITDTILKLKGQITIIAIAHRISTLENCDFKIKFDTGKAEVLANME